MNRAEPAGIARRSGAREPRGGGARVSASVCAIGPGAPGSYRSRAAFRPSSRRTNS